MSLAGGLFWSILIVGRIPLLAVAGALLVRRWVTVEVLERHNEVAGFIYAVIGVLYAVLLGFTAIIVWERFNEAQTNVEKEANDLGDLFRDAQAFPEDFRKTWKLTCVPMSALLSKKSGQRWPKANRAPKPGMPITSFGRATIGSTRRMRTKGFGTASRSQD